MRADSVAPASATRAGRRSRPTASSASSTCATQAELADDAQDAAVEVVRVPLLDGLDAESYADARVRTRGDSDDAAQAKATLYAVALDRCRGRFADALTAIADAPPAPWSSTAPRARIAPDSSPRSSCACAA